LYNKSMSMLLVIVSVVLISSCSMLEEFGRAYHLSPEDIIKMSDAGVSDDVIISQIKATRSIYKLSPEGIIKLKEEGVSDKVIEEMVKTARVPAYQDYETLMFYDYYGYPFGIPYYYYPYLGVNWHNRKLGVYDFHYYSPYIPPYYFGGYNIDPSRYFIRRDTAPYWWYHIQPDPNYWRELEKKPWDGKIEVETDDR